MPQPAWVKTRLAPEPAASRYFYELFMKRSSSYMTTTMFVALFVGVGFDYAMNAYWESCNKGKLWHHIKDTYKEEE